MTSIDEVIAAANSLKEQDEAALELQIGLRAKAIERDESLKSNPNLSPQYDNTHMGLHEDVQALGRRILLRWSRELHSVVCGSNPADAQKRQTVLDALNLSESAVIGAVAGVLIALGLFPALAAAVA